MEVSSYERIAISYRGGKKGKKTGASRSQRYPDTHQYQSGRRSSRGRDVVLRRTEVGRRIFVSSASSCRFAVRHDAARCTHARTTESTGMPATGAALNTRAYFRGRREKINSVVRAKSGTAFQHAVDAMRLTRSVARP